MWTLPPLECPLEELPDEDRADDEVEGREEEELDEEIRGIDRGADAEPELLELDPRLTVPRDAVVPLLPVMDR